MGGEKAFPLLCRFGERMHVVGVITKAPVVARRSDVICDAMRRKAITCRAA